MTQSKSSLLVLGSRKELLLLSSAIEKEFKSNEVFNVSSNHLKIADSKSNADELTLLIDTRYYDLEIDLKIAELSETALNEANKLLESKEANLDGFVVFLVNNKLKESSLVFEFLEKIDSTHKNAFKSIILDCDFDNKKLDTLENFVKIRLEAAKIQAEGINL